jgi:hypothetical protein
MYSEPTPTTTAVTGAMAELRLQRLDLTIDELHEAVRLGYAAAAGCTDHDPRSLPGTLAWGKGIGHLRDFTKPRGWKADRTANFETTVHPTGSHAVAIAAGTSQTGCVGGVAPRTRTPKGPATHRAVKRNAQFPLGHGTDVFAGTGGEVEEADRETWLLLHHYDRNEQAIRLELSCPSEMKGKQITAWSERIILPPLSFSANVDVTDFEDTDEAEAPIDIAVRRKAN